MIIVPPSNATIETIIEFAGLTYDGYSLIAAEPEHLERLLHPLFDDIRTTLTVPAWIGLDLARALLFYAQRLHYWSGGVDSDEPLRALVAHIGRISGGRVEHRGAASLQQERSPVAGSATHGEFTDSWEYSHDEVYRWWYQRRWSSGPTLCFVGLNPSTGDTEGKPRPTLRKVVGWAKREVLARSLSSTSSATERRSPMRSSRPASTSSATATTKRSRGFRETQRSHSRRGAPTNVPPPEPATSSTC